MYSLYLLYGFILIHVDGSYDRFIACIEPKTVSIQSVCGLGHYVTALRFHANFVVGGGCCESPSRCDSIYNVPGYSKHWLLARCLETTQHFLSLRKRTWRLAVLGNFRQQFGRVFKQITCNNGHSRRRSVCSRWLHHKSSQFEPIQESMGEIGPGRWSIRWLDPSISLQSMSLFILTQPYSAIVPGRLLTLERFLGDQNSRSKVQDYLLATQWKWTFIGSGWRAGFDSSHPTSFWSSKHSLTAWRWRRRTHWRDFLSNTPSWTILSWKTSHESNFENAMASIKRIKDAYRCSGFR